MLGLSLDWSRCSSNCSLEWYLRYNQLNSECHKMRIRPNRQVERLMLIPCWNSKIRALRQDDSDISSNTCSPDYFQTKHHSPPQQAETEDSISPRSHKSILQNSLRGHDVSRRQVYAAIYGVGAIQQEHGPLPSCDKCDADQVDIHLSFAGHVLRLRSQIQRTFRWNCGILVTGS